MLELLKSIWERAANEGGVVAGAPILFAGSALFLTAIASFGIWNAIGWSYQAKLDGQLATVGSLNDRLKLKDDQIADYKEKLNGATPDEAKKRIEALEIQLKALSPRRLSEKDKRIIIDAVKGTRGIISITQDMAAPDAKGMSADLAYAFQSAGWGVELPMVMGPSNVPPSGLGLRVRDPNNLRPLEQSVRSALQAAGVSFDIQAGLRASPKRPSLPVGFPTIPEKPDPDAEILITTKGN